MPHCNPTNPPCEGSLGPPCGNDSEVRDLMAWIKVESDDCNVDPVGQGPTYIFSGKHADFFAVYGSGLYLIGNPDLSDETNLEVTVTRVDKARRLPSQSANFSMPVKDCK